MLSEIHALKWVIGCCGLCLLTWIEVDPSSGQQHWWQLKACLGIRRVYTKVVIDFIRETRALRYLLWIWWCHSDCPYVFWTVSHLFFVIWTSEIDIFLHISSRMSKYVKQCSLHWNSTNVSDVKCIWGQYAFRPSVKLSCDYEIIFHGSQQSCLKWE